MDDGCEADEKTQIPLSTHLDTDGNVTAIDIRLGDLDLKSAANGKAEYWLSIEKKLIDEGWYIGTQSSQVASDGECALSR